MIAPPGPPQKGETVSVSELRMREKVCFVFCDFFPGGGGGRSRGLHVGNVHPVEAVPTRGLWARVLVKQEAGKAAVALERETVDVHHQQHRAQRARDSCVFVRCFGVV